MERQSVLRNRKLLVPLMVGALLILAAWLERTPLLVFYAVHGLQRAEEHDRQCWVERVAALDRAALPKLIDCLRRAERRVCANTQAGLMEMARNWGPGDVRRVKMAECLAERLATLSEPGAVVALQIQEQLWSTSGDLDLVPAVSRILTETSLTSNTAVHAHALAWVASLLERGTFSELISACRKLTQKCLGDDPAANRIQATRLALRPEIGLIEALVPLLSDPVPEVRRLAILGLGPAPDVLNTDDLLRWLHDPDAVVRRLCEDTLRGRGLTGEHIKLGRLMSDNRPEVRLQVVECLRDVNDLDPGVWLRQLSHDPAPAVRAAAIRAATEQAVSGLGDRLEQMTQNDPCPSIRQLAQYYLTFQRSGMNGRAEP